MPFVADPTTAPRGAAQPMLLDAHVPVFDATRIEHRVIDGDLPAVYEAVLTADLTRAFSDNRAVRLVFSARTAGEHVVARVRGRRPVPVPPPASLRLVDMGTHGEWVRIGEAPPHEFAFGAAGRFWGGETTWIPLDAETFATFQRPGTAKIGCNFSLRPYGSGRTLVSYEARTLGADAQVRRSFLTYWRAVSVGVGIVMRAQLAVIDREAARRR